MKSTQIPFYAACPILYWPWLWLQFRRLDRWMAQRVANGNYGEVMLHLGPRGTLTISMTSDNLRGDLPPSYTTITLDSLTWGYTPEWMYTVARTLTCQRAIGDVSISFTKPAEIADALIPIP